VLSISWRWHTGGVLKYCVGFFKMDCNTLWKYQELPDKILDTVFFVLIGILINKFCNAKVS